MLIELNITDFAIIERLSLRLADGFNVLTGETGAGKSIIIDALGTLRGERPDATFVRTGADRARIEGVFSTSDRPDLASALDEYGLRDDSEADGQVILTREINRESGRSVARVNGRAVSSAVLREIGTRLVDIHGQHEGLSIFNVRTHAEMLDRYGGLVVQRDALGAQVAELRRVRDALAQLQRAAATRSERIEELQLLRDDVAQAKLRPNEEDDLLRERALVQNGAKISEIVAGAHRALAGGEESGAQRRPGRAAVEALGAVADAIAELARLDPAQQRLAEQATEVRYAAEDLAANVRAYRDAMEFDAARLDKLEDRLTLLRELQRKYRGTVDEILARAADADTEIERLTNTDEAMADLSSQEQQLLRRVGELAGTLSHQRRAVGERLSAAVQASVRDLAMPHVRFNVACTQTETADGAPVDGRTLAFDRTGVDRIEFLLAPNPGEPLKPLAKIASGGEGARLLLALKSILSEVDEVPTLIFDEVDVGVGGRAGGVVGEKLWSISEHHQVICITHLPQVAAFGDVHYGIAKQVEAGRTRTRVDRLDDHQRADEIAAMLDGTPVSSHSRAAAVEMLDRARSFKERSMTGVAL